MKINRQTLVTALENPVMEMYHHGDVRLDAAHIVGCLYGGEEMVEQAEEAVLIASPKEDEMVELIDKMLDLASGKKGRTELRQGIKHIASLLEAKQLELFNATTSAEDMIKRMKEAL